MAIEIAFPSCAEVQLPKPRMNEYRLFDMTMPNVFDMNERNYEFDHWMLYSGSRAEGLAMKVGWGHEEPDIDQMCIWKHLFGVPVTLNRDNSNSSVAYPSPVGGEISLETSESHPGYCRLRVYGDNEQVVEFMASDRRYCGDPQDMRRHCIVQRDGRWWISSTKVVKYYTIGMGDVHQGSQTGGPAVPRKCGNTDFVTTLACSSALPYLDGFLSRPRFVDWPPSYILSKISELPTLIVAAAHRSSKNRDIEWRISCSHYELFLANAMPLWVKQAYWAFKYIMKYKERLYKNGGTDQRTNSQPPRNRGRSKLSSFHFKTAMLWELEKPDTWLNELSFDLLIRLFHAFVEFVTERTMPHYFISDCNVLEGVDPDELVSNALYIKERVLCDPISAIITSPKYPRQLYGCEGSQEYVKEIEIVLGFRYISDAAMSGHKAVCKSLALMRRFCLRLDKHRRQRYSVIAKTRKNSQHDLQSLVNMLNRISKIAFYFDNWKFW